MLNARKIYMPLPVLIVAAMVFCTLLVSCGSKKETPPAAPAANIPAGSNSQFAAQQRQQEQDLQKGEARLKQHLSQSPP